MVNDRNGWLIEWYQQDTLFTVEDSSISEEVGEQALRNYQESSKGVDLHSSGTLQSEPLLITAPRSQLNREQLLRRNQHDVEYQKKLKEARRRNAGFWSNRAYKARGNLSQLTGSARAEKLLSMRDPWLTDSEQKEKQRILKERGKHSEPDRSDYILSRTTNLIDTSGGLHRNHTLSQENVVDLT